MTAHGRPDFDADVVVVGGGPAGLSTALHLVAAAPRLRVMVIEQRAYPRDKICAGAIGARAFVDLARIGVALPFGSESLPAIAINAFEIDIGGERIQAREPEAAQVVRRLAFDAELAAIARARGVIVREQCKLTGFLRARDSVTIHVEDEGGSRSLTTRALVGADGVSGIVRRLAGFARGSLRAQAVEVDTPRTDGDPPVDTLRFGFSPTLRGYTWDFPTPLHGGVMMSRGVYLLRDQPSNTDAAEPARAHLAAHLAHARLRLADFRPRQLAEQGFAAHAPLATPRVLLVGEAAGIDFPTGEGIAQSLAYGRVAGPYLAEALAHDRLSFADWSEAWARSEEGRFLRQRALGGRLLFGEGRGKFQRALGRSPAVFSLILRRFAGGPFSRALLLRAAGEMAQSFARS